MILPCFVQKPSLADGKPAKEKSSADKPSLSTAWDVSYMDAEPKKKKKGKKSRRNSISEIDSSKLQGMNHAYYNGSINAITGLDMCC